MVKIAIDAGHGLPTPGRRIPASMGYGEVQEWTLNNRVAVALEGLLKDYKDVRFIRLDDPTGKRDVPLRERTNLANAWGADMLISNHHNAGANGTSAGGLVVFRYYDSTKFTASMLNSLYNSIIAQTGLVGNRAVPKAEASFHMIRESNMPAVLIEHGFMDSTSDVPVIMQSNFPILSATGIMNFLVNHYNLEEGEPGEEPVTEGLSARVYANNEVLVASNIVEHPDADHRFVPSMSKDGTLLIKELIEDETATFSLNKDGILVTPKLTEGGF